MPSDRLETLARQLGSMDLGPARETVFTTIVVRDALWLVRVALAGRGLLKAMDDDRLLRIGDDEARHREVYRAEDELRELLK